MMLPRLYAIVDAGRFASAPDPAAAVAGFARELFAAGVTLLQYRNKDDYPPRQLDDARSIRRLAPEGLRLIMNDRADLALAAGCEGVHLGQDDLSPAAARRILGNTLWVGVSTHSVEQVTEADASPADYIAVGPVFATASKAHPDPVIGLDGVRAARALTRKPLVAIGGITRTNARSVLDAGADSVAVISDLLDAPCKSAEAFLRLLG
jgi:thiamine-phosphate pyrophosphorylase